MATSFASEEFRIDGSKKGLVERHTKKVERLFGVKVAFDVLAIIGDARNQWLVVSGNKENRQNATVYIQAMCNPEQTTSVKVTGQPSLDDVVLEEAERASATFIQRTGSLTLQVMGSELGCALALSHLEQTYQVTIISLESGDEETVSAPSKPEASDPHPVTEVISTALTNGMRDLVMDSSDHTPSPSSHDTQPIASGTVPPSQTDQRSPHPNVSLPHAAHSVFSHSPTKRTGNSPAMGSSPVLVPMNRGSTGAASSGNSTEGEDRPKSQNLKLRPKTDTEEDGPEDGKIGSHCREPAKDPQKLKAQLKSLGAGMGYTQAEIKETWPFFDFSQQYVQPHEFLSALDKVRAYRLKSSSKKNPAASTPNASPSSGGDITGLPLSPKGSGQGKQKSRKGKQGKKAGMNDPTSPKAITVMSPHSSPKHVIYVRHEENSSLDNSVIYVREEENDDSVICVGETVENDSVCLVDSPSVASSPIKHSGDSLHIGAARKRKEYSDDEDQTKVLKPYSSSNTGSASRRQTALFTQASEPSTLEQQSGAASASAEDTTVKDNSDLRFIVIDGSNVAMAHGNDKEFSCRGIKLCVDYFVKRGHRVKAWVPRTKTYQNRTGRFPPILNQEILEELKDQGYLGYTPARTFNTKHIVSHDDPFILELAQKEDAVIISNDNFREFVKEFGYIIENRVLSYVFSDDHFMLPRDPLGRYGPTLEQFLRKTPCCLPHKQPMRRGPQTGESVSSHASLGQGHEGPPTHHFLNSRRQLNVEPSAFQSTHSNPCQGAPGPHPAAPANPRPKKVTQQLFEALKMVFPEKKQEAKIRQVLVNHCAETDLNKLTNYCISALNL